MKFQSVFTDGEKMVVEFDNKEELVFDCQDLLYEGGEIIEVSLDGEEGEAENIIVEELHEDGALWQVYYSVDDILEIYQDAA